METLVVTEVVEATPVEVTPVVTPTPEPADPRTLVICLDEDPEEINFNYFFELEKNPVQEALFDGPIDERDL